MPPERRHRLVRIAAAEFASAGYEQASLNKIIKACGLSKSSFYHVFDAKQDLFDLVVSDLLAELRTKITVPSPDAFAGDQFWPAAARAWNALLASAADEALLALGRMFHLGNAPAPARGTVTETLAVVRTWLRDVLAQGREAGEVRSDLPLDLQEELVFAVLQAFDAWTLARTDLSPADLSDLAEAQWATVRRVLAS